MKLEKDRLNSKVESLEISLKQIKEEQSIVLDEGSQGSQGSPNKFVKPKGKAILKMTNEPTVIPQKERHNPCSTEEYEPSGSHMTN